MMCGRTATVATFRQYYEHFLVSGEPPEGGVERYNLSPSRYRKKNDPNSVVWEHLPVVRSVDNERRLDMLIWPLIPHWSKGVLPTFKTANCRAEPNERFSETVAKKATFRDAWKKDRRCLIPVNWFFEWDQHTKPKQPYLIKDIEKPFLVFAGLWATSTTEDGYVRHSCTIITTEANECLKNVGHHRSPVMLDEKHYDTWLHGSKDEAESLITPYPSDTLKAIKMPFEVNNPNYDSPELIPAAA